MVKREFISVKNFSAAFPVKNSWFYAVDDVSFSLAQDRFIAIVGESGCGKSVLGQGILGILPENVRKEGCIYYKGEKLNGLLAAGAGIFDLIPQNPGDSLNPTRKIARQMQDILDVVNIKDPDNAYKAKCLQFFGLEDIPRVLAAYPHELSGGMLQRVLCAMSISAKPRWILADEPTKGLDEQVTKVVLDNLRKMKSSLNLGMLIITHDLKLAGELCDEIIVMYAGQVMEINSDIFNHPLHPYTQAFLEALPVNGLKTIPGRAPAPGEEITGCRFVPRCKRCLARCLKSKPDLYITSSGAQVRCFLYAGR